MAELTNVPKMSDFDRFLWEEPYRLERYYGMVQDVEDLNTFRKECVQLFHPEVQW